MLVVGYIFVEWTIILQYMRARYCRYKNRYLNTIDMHENV